jgi:hypothetical protein
MGCFMMNDTEAQNGFTEVDISEFMIDEESEDSVNIPDKIEDMQRIRNIENKYGLIIFKMGLSHWADVGSRFLTPENIEESRKQIIAQGEIDKAEGKLSMMKPEFLCEVLNCAAELSIFSIWTLFKYIKEYVVISD